MPGLITDRNLVGYPRLGLRQAPHGALVEDRAKGVVFLGIGIKISKKVCFETIKEFKANSFFYWFYHQFCGMKDLLNRNPWPFMVK